MADTLSFNAKVDMVDHKFDCKTCVLPTADRNRGIPGHCHRESLKSQLMTFGRCTNILYIECQKTNLIFKNRYYK